MENVTAAGQTAGDDNGAGAGDSFMVAFLVAARLLGRGLAESDVRRRSGIHRRLIPSDLDAVAAVGGWQAERLELRRIDPARLPVPALAETRDGGVVVVARGDASGVLVVDPDTGEQRALDVDGIRKQLSGTVHVFHEREGEGETRFGLRTFFPGLLRYRGAVAQLLGASLLIQLFAMATPLFTMVVIDRVLTTGSLSTLDVLILGLAAIALFDLAIGILRGSLLADITNRVDLDIVARLFRHLTRLPMSYFSGRRTGDTVARVRELESVRQFLTGPTLTALVDFVFAFVFILVMMLFSVKLTLIVLAAMVLLLVMYAVVAPVMKRRLEERFAGTMDSQSFLVEAVAGMETMKSLSLEPQMQRRWEEQVVDQTRFSRDSERMTANLSQCAQFINKGTIALTLWFGAQAVIGGSLTAGQLIAFNMMVGRVMAPALRLAQLFQQFSQTRVSIRRLGEIFNVRPEPERERPDDQLPPMRGAVRFEQVSLRYNPELPDALREVSFEVSPGEVIGVVGSSGAGKSSLLRLLQRLYVPQQGRILIDGVNIAEIDPVWLRRHVGAVTQDSVLFNGSVRDNIAAARPELAIERIEAAARLAAADEFIRALPKAYDTPVGERGAQLSVGQRQRIALARALAAEPRMLLLDEPTSSLDAVAERAIQERMDEIVSDRTVFLVAHRLSTLRVCDRLIVFDDGRLVEQGPPQALLQSDGRFAALARAQQPFTLDSTGWQEVRHENVAT